MNCELILKDEVNVKFNGLHGEVLRHLNKRFNYEVEGAKFSAQVKLGMWDGYISLFSMDGETYLNFLPTIIPILVDELGVKIEVVDNRDNKRIKLDPIDNTYFKHIIHPETGEPLILRDYQVDMVNTLISGDMKGIGIAGTGAGKTSITATICSVFNAVGIKCLVIVPSTSLVKQTKASLISCGLDVGEFSGKVKETENKTIIATWQTLQNIPQFVSQFGQILVDEVHGAKSKVVKDLLVNYGRNIKYRYGVTATLPKDELSIMTIKAAIGDVKYEIHSHELIAAGHLARLDITIVQLVEDLKEEYGAYLESETSADKLTYAKFKQGYFVDYTNEKSYLRSHGDRIDHIAKMLVAESINGNVFTLVDSIAFGKKLTKAVMKLCENEHIYFVYGKDKVEDRKEVYDLFKDNDGIIVVATVSVAGTGLDISRIYNLFLIDLGKSFIRTLQTIGRGLRKAKDKDYINVIDICSDLKYSKRHVSERIKFYKEAKYPHKKTKVDY